MSYDEIEIEDMSWNETLQAFTYPCPCGDLFQITMVGSRPKVDVESAPLGALRCWSGDCWSADPVKGTLHGTWRHAVTLLP